MTKTHQVVKIQDAYYLLGVYHELDDRRDGPGLYLLARYDEGDCDRPYNQRLMHSALYDAHQCHEFASDGDVVETPHGQFVVRGVHVEPVDQTSAEARARRARLRRIARRAASSR